MRPLALVVGVIAVLASWYWLEELSVGMLLVDAYLFAPWGLLAFGVPWLTEPARGIALALVIAMGVAMHVAIVTSDPWNGAHLGWLWLPLAQGLVIGLVVVLQEVARSKPHR